MPWQVLHAGLSMLLEKWRLQWKYNDGMILQKVSSSDISGVCWNIRYFFLFLWYTVFAHIQASLDGYLNCTGARYLKERSFKKLFRHWDSKVGGSALSHNPFGPCPVPMQGNDTANIVQTDACAIEFILRMEALECANKLCLDCVFGIELPIPYKSCRKLHRRTEIVSNDRHNHTLFSDSNLLNCTWLLDTMKPYTQRRHYRDIMGGFVCLASISGISVTSESAVLRPTPASRVLMKWATSASGTLIMCARSFRASSGETDRHWNSGQGTFANSFTPGSIWIWHRVSEIACINACFIYKKQHWRILLCNIALISTAALKKRHTSYMFKREGLMAMIWAIGFMRKR